MEDIFAFIDSFTMEDRLYWQLPHAYRDELFELVWNKQDRPERWALRRMSEESWDEVATETLLSLLQRRRVDVDQTKRILGASVITQAVYASLVVEAAEKLFGKNALQQAFADSNRFLTQLLKKVDAAAGRDHLQLVKK